MVTGALRPTGARSAGYEAIADASDAQDARIARFSDIDSEESARSVMNCFTWAWRRGISVFVAKRSGNPRGNHDNQKRSRFDRGIRPRRIALLETRNGKFGTWYWVGQRLPWSQQTEARGQKFRSSDGDLEPERDEIRWHTPGVA